MEYRDFCYYRMDSQAVLLPASCIATGGLQTNAQEASNDPGTQPLVAYLNELGGLLCFCWDTLQTI